MTADLASVYEDRYERVLVPIATRLETHLKEILYRVERVDSVSSRAKSPVRFISKAFKKDDQNNSKYSNPLSEVQDQIGARVTVLYLPDVDAVKDAIGDYFHAIEWQVKRPEKDEEFGYFGDHYILRLPDDVVPEGLEGEAPRFFELQIKTLYQHAWSEAHHDIGYKAPRPLTSHERRQMAFSAAQSWGADQIFLELARSLVKDPENDR